MNVVMFGTNDWRHWEAEGFCSRCGCIASRLAVHPMVENLLVVSTARSGAVNLARIVARAAGRNGPDRGASLAPSRLVSVSPGIHVLDHTRLLPREQSWPLAHHVNAALFDRYLRRVIRRSCAVLGMERPVLWVSNPLMAKHLGTIGETVAVLDVFDDLSLHPVLRSLSGTIRQAVSLAAQNADLVFAASRELTDRLQRLGANASWQPNGVDVGRFTASHPIPTDLADVGKPIVGYVGMIQSRVDTDLIEAAAVRMPDVAFVLIGPVSERHLFRRVQQLRNVHMLGARDPQEIPAYLQAFDVCMVPHRDDGFTRCMDPLKIYEYCAIGKRVVTAGVPDMGEPAGLFDRAEDHESFIANLERALVDPTAGNEARRAFAQSRSWDKRIAEILDAVERARVAKG